MHVLLISNCEKKAISKTRRILDRFASRIGASTWATPITEDALEEVHRALKRQATRQTSVACYRNDGVRGMRLVWVVGNANNYDNQGAYAMETRSTPTELPFHLRQAALLAYASGLAHDFGKATKRFKSKLLETEVAKMKDAIRHEWISAWLLSEMRGDYSSENFQNAWKTWQSEGQEDVRRSRGPWLPHEDGRAFDDVHGALAFVISTHHRLYGPGVKRSHGNAPPKIMTNDRHIDNGGNRSGLNICLIKGIESGILPSEWISLIQELESTTKRLAPHEGVEAVHYWRGIALIARTALVLADHDVSSKDRSHESHEKSDKDMVWANSIKRAQGRSYNQTLTWHLEHVAKQARENIRMFDAHDLPALDRADMDKLLTPSGIERFKWQDEAASFLAEHAQEKPSLVFNIASTGSGKTLGNLKAAAAMRKNALRISAGFNLRTLTLQTRDAYRHQTGLDSTDIACVIGEPLIEKLHDFAACDDENNDNDVVAQIEAEDQSFRELPDWISHIPEKQRTQATKLLASPVLVTTMDHLVNAGEPGEQAAHAYALLRVSSSDLIVDEADSYDPSGLMSVLRVIEMSAMFGRNVIISSATLPPVLADAIQKAWLSGVSMFKAMQPHAIVGNIFAISDKLPPSGLAHPGDYAMYAAEMSRQLSTTTKLFEVVDDEALSFHEVVKNSVLELHSNNHEAHGDKRVSIGLVRMANVMPCMDVAGYLMQAEWPNDLEVHVTSYHASDILARRTLKERVLDKILDRKNESNPWWNKDDETRQRLKASTQRNVIFIVVASPVEEVGRDHDFDWAVIEPSSMISIIQTSGRVNRHRIKTVTYPNIHVVNLPYAKKQNNKKPNKIFYSRPGFQTILNDENITHCIGSRLRDAQDLLGLTLKNESEEIGHIHAMTSAMIFGDDRTPFAVEDEKGIQKAISGALKALEDQTSWMNAWVYDTYPLRDRNKKDEFNIKENDGKLAVEFKYSRNHIEHSIDETSHSEAWLCPKIGDVIERMKIEFNDEDIIEKQPSLMSFSIYRKDNSIEPIKISLLGIQQQS